MALSTEKLIEFDKKLLILALSEFDVFCQIAKVDKTQAYVCMEKARGKSSGTIANALGVTPQAVDKRFKKCKAC